MDVHTLNIVEANPSMNLGLDVAADFPLLDEKLSLRPVVEHETVKLCGRACHTVS